jgi:1-deoxy-D-xylulose-5-phosphate reductoisomerase
VGVNTLKVIDEFPQRFEVVGLTALNSTKALDAQIARYRPKYAALAAEHIPGFHRRYSRVRFFDARSDIEQLVTRADIDIVVIAVTGAAALAPFLAAVRAGKKIAPANKEALVMAGEILMAEARTSGAVIVPVDSEQSAIFQCLEGRNREDVHKIHLTASESALYGVPRRQHDALTVAQVLAHPRWKMGAKITVDSATLMNKGFEVIEAQRLFGIDAARINVVVHPQALIHSMVEFKDGCILAQLGVTDMRLPIQYALSYPSRLDAVMGRLDPAAMGALTFSAPDTRTFPSLALAYEALRRGGSAPAVLNAADEIAVDAFLKGAIKFTAIHKVVERTLVAHRTVKEPVLRDIEQVDAWARCRAVEETERLA